MWGCVRLLRVMLALTLPSLPFFDISTELIPCQKHDIVCLVQLTAKTSHISRKFSNSINSACGKIELHSVGRRLQKKAKQTNPKRFHITMQVKYTTAFILLLTFVLAAPDAALIRRYTASDNDVNSQTDDAASDALPFTTDAAAAANSFTDSIPSGSPSVVESPLFQVAQSLVSDAEALGTDLATIPAVSTAIAEAQSLATEAEVRVSIAATAVDTVLSSLYEEAVAIYISAQTIISSVANKYEPQTSTAQTSTAQISTAQVSTTQNGGSNAINEATTSSLTAGAVMPTSGFGISLAGLAGIVGVIVIAL